MNTYEKNSKTIEDNSIAFFGKNPPKQGEANHRTGSNFFHSEISNR